MTEKSRPSPEYNNLCAMPARGINFLEVAMATNGCLSYYGGRDHLRWNEIGGMLLEWRDDPGKPGERTLFFWRGEYGRGGMEKTGLVVGKNFVAFVNPDENPALISGEMIMDGKVLDFSGPVEMFNPMFLTAKIVALQYLKENLV